MECSAAKSRLWAARAVVVGRMRLIGLWNWNGMSSEPQLRRDAHGVFARNSRRSATVGRAMRHRRFATLAALLVTGGSVFAQNMNLTVLSCSAGVCDSTCDVGFANCTTPLAPTTDDGCETITLTDENHCGACGVVCSEGMVCSNGLCQ